MNLFHNYILRSLVCQELQTVRLGSEGDYRTHEADNVGFILNILADELLEGGKWSFVGGDQETSTDHRKAVRFFKSGSVRYWVDPFRKAIEQRLGLLEPDDKAKLLCRPVDDSHKSLIKTVVRRLVNHPIWTDDDGNIDSQLNENKSETSKTLFKSYPIPLHTAYLLDISQ